ncbi:plant UBX domain-containing protein 8-like [Gossypium australe]|uniref:Plant UBX domain-containing protein 8-like n=1 Tax=Gossypium australe TaxID=47621 RepID=A0A5B6U5B7_9ROSI|nr:plant UBX domain-containing protein 8-like [Gossypium australe]
MVRPNQEAIDTFISITGAPEAVAISMLELKAGNHERRDQASIELQLCNVFEAKALELSDFEKRQVN